MQNTIFRRKSKDEKLEADIIIALRNACHIYAGAII